MPTRLDHLESGAVVIVEINKRNVILPGRVGLAFLVSLLYTINNFAIYHSLVREGAQTTSDRLIHLRGLCTMHYLHVFREEPSKKYGMVL